MLVLPTQPFRDAVRYALIHWKCHIATREETVNHRVSRRFGQSRLQSVNKFFIRPGSTKRAWELPQGIIVRMRSLFLPSSWYQTLSSPHYNRTTCRNRHHMILVDSLPFRPSTRLIPKLSSCHGPEDPRPFHHMLREASRPASRPCCRETRGPARLHCSWDGTS